MIFNSLSFLIFFVTVTTLYYIVPFRFRWLVLLIASCFFYMSFIPKYLLILGVLIGTDYTVARLMQRAGKTQRKYLLIFSIVSNIGILFAFKYFNFFQTNIAAVVRAVGWNYSPRLLEILLPIGLSFHTFQSLSYVIEVYKRKYKAETHFGMYALYVMFYPQLVAGPIERPAGLLTQLHKKYVFAYADGVEGFRRILIGLFKKLIIADRLAILVNQVYGHPYDYVGFPLVIATVAFAFQVYADFSGYSDIAIGTARVMGFRLRENFNAPYFASSIADFWRRWHMSLYAWFRDYIYIPLGGNRHGRVVQIRNIIIVFLVTGLWHGANWTYVLWGGLHGLYMSSAALIGTYIVPFISVRLSWFGRMVVKLFGMVFTFGLVSFAWIFFRAATLSDGLYIVSHMTTGLGALMKFILAGQSNLVYTVTFAQHGGMDLAPVQIGIAAVAIIVIEIIQKIDRSDGFRRLSVWNRWGIYIMLILAVLNLGPANQVPFIYFQF